MSWTIVCDLHMDSYQGNRALDATGFRNDGIILGNAAAQADCVTFQGDDAQLEVPVRDDSLTRFAALRVQARLRPVGAAHRYNIAEGWMSFAFFIEADGRLAATIYDGQNWVGLDSGATTVAPGAWARVSFEYDGVSIGKLTLNGSTVGSRLDMPPGMYQPQQVIALGHWPRGDGRYTLQGDLGHVRIERRDYEDYARDAVRTGLCHRRLTPTQANAMREIEYLVSTMDPEEQKQLRECAMRNAAQMRVFMHDLRALVPRGGYLLRDLGEQLRAAWCCSFNAPAAREALREYLRSVGGQPGSQERARLEEMVEEFLRISTTCARRGYPYDRIRELCGMLFPELQSFEIDLRDLVATM